MLGCWVCEVLAGVQLYSPGPGLYCSSHTALGWNIGLETSLLNERLQHLCKQAFASFPQMFVMVSQVHVVCLPQPPHAQPAIIIWCSCKESQLDCIPPPHSAPPHACTSCYHHLVQLQRQHAKQQIHLYEAIPHGKTAPLQSPSEYSWKMVHSSDTWTHAEWGLCRNQVPPIAKNAADKG